jgi:nucleoside-diphosphate-sugar epimerase
MWIENKIFHEDMEVVTKSAYLPWDKLQNKTIFITGATGLIGFNLVSALAYAARYKNLSLKILALVRDEEKAKERFNGALADGAPLTFILGDLDHIPAIEEHIDYIIHGGSPTASRYFADHPVETIMTNLHSAIHLLKLARKHHSEGFLFLSSMEVYGGIHCHEKVDETHENFVDTMIPRNSYPEVKRMVESLCACFASEYGVPAKSIRLTQTFGAGVQCGDNRVFAQFAYSVMKHKNITMITPGGTERSYLYTADAVAAILTVLLKGKSGEAYNAANEKTYCSIKEMAEIVANLDIIKEKYNGPVSVVIDQSKNDGKMYPPELYMDLDTTKLKKLGWQATYGLKDMFTRMICTME